MNEITVLILARDEQRNITKCLASLVPVAHRVVVVDSLSSDRTVEIARQHGADVYERAWTNYADQFNWGLDNTGIDTPWTMRMDADEELTPELAAALSEFLRDPPEEVGGLYVRRRVYFLGKWIRFGGYYPTWLLRVWRTRSGRCETRMMDEHIVLTQGSAIRLQADIIDRNNKDLTFWTAKHNSYASREAADILGRFDVARACDLEAGIGGEQDASKRWMKNNLYLRLPLFLRPFLYFVYRYFLRLGFLDGVRGLIFHFLQAFWYRFLVDAKVYESRLLSGAATGDEGRAE